ncbi:apolipoprotein N-acyltransferase [Roseomonas mucosa]|uniref:apolipoprotein N-acyltransferase n=1 Tax=Roseomonas mucosa TaxID=207340 RepID=UPI00384CE56A
MRPDPPARRGAAASHADDVPDDPLPARVLVTLARPPWAVATARAAAALALGAASPLALAPLHLLPALFLAFGGLLLLLERTPTVRGALLLGWLFGLGSFAVGLSWITEAFAVDAERFGALALPALIGLSAVLALFPAAGVAAARAVMRGDDAGRGGAGLLAALAAGWTAAEWLRSVLLTGFPWNLVGTAWGFADAPLQAVSVIGPHGLGLLTVAVAAAPALALGERRWWPPLAASAAGVALLWGFGLLRLAAPLPPDLPGVRLRLVQPDVAQSLKWAPEERERILARLLAMTRAPAAAGAAPTHVIWPETAVPYLVAEQSEVREAMAAALPPGAALLTGAVRRVPDGAGGLSLRNALLVLDGTGEVVSAYDKIRLVPFGEYVPLRRLLSAVPKLTVGSTDFAPGPPRRPLSVPGLPGAWPLICYEAVFPGALPEGARPGWILTVTNDAWFGTSWGPYQHALAARLRAVELGLPLVRAANGGVSLVTDGYGRVRASLGLGTRGVLDAAFPAAVPGGTHYSWLGDLPFGVAVAMLLVVSWFRRRKVVRSPA